MTPQTKRTHGTACSLKLNWGRPGYGMLNKVKLELNVFCSIGCSPENLKPKVCSNIVLLLSLLLFLGRRVGTSDQCKHQFIHPPEPEAAISSTSTAILLDGRKSFSLHGVSGAPDNDRPTKSYENKSRSFSFLTLCKLFKKACATSSRVETDLDDRGEQRGLL